MYHQWSGYIARSGRLVKGARRVLAEAPPIVERVAETLDSHDLDDRDTLEAIDRGFSGQFDRIGSGSGRWVYGINDSWVLKLARPTGRGAAANEAEWQWSGRTDSIHFAPVMRTPRGKGFRYIFQSRAAPFDRDVFERRIGVPFKTFTAWLTRLAYERPDMGEAPPRPDKRPAALRDLLAFAEWAGNRTALAELRDDDQWGIEERSERPVIVDYGFTEVV